ncbi:MAG: hypothetical protein VXW15_09720 [Bdellovibrionota bacterium]|nr:hypothetical protein [Bdellovibrionota bacterium]
MAIIVEHLKSKEKFILLGSGYGVRAQKKGGVFFEGIGGAKLCVSKGDGSVWWVNDEDVQVISVDGKRPDEILKN